MFHILKPWRGALIKCFAALGIGIVPMFLTAPYCMNLLIKIMITDNNIALNYFSPMEVFILQIKMAVVLDLLLCFPYMAKKIWEFLLPGLLENERQFVQVNRFEFQFIIYYRRFILPVLHFASGY